MAHLILLQDRLRRSEYQDTHTIGESTSGLGDVITSAGQQLPSHVARDQLVCDRPAAFVCVSEATYQCPPLTHFAEIDLPPNLLQ
ncbi:hypothetical protein OHU11_41915 (plasmid) [Streptomyces sp. NBC_00257]|uniref:hypothetical protein n=1 Tax=unclassified Streptomyces TaxID=2593676 RepID=UPI002254F89B|nr:MULTISPECIES: hypothetical protein [unclassified Streptomyces]MCX5434739.1 hypothetical protein [Streptomyces sp. NBC_00062]